MVKAARIIPDAVRATQARASDPAASSFVSANAGSGKTHVLVQRVIRLLLGGVAPEKILCITFTKAAAANMAERVFSTLGHWVTLDDAALDAAIREAGIPHPSARLRKSARKLFACALETPGGLKVQTIHALCTRLLQQFPFEANVPARGWSAPSTHPASPARRRTVCAPTCASVRWGWECRHRGSRHPARRRRASPNGRGW